MTRDESQLPASELLRRAMRCWVTGVAIVTSDHAGHSHGMTVNSFGSISLDPPLVTVTMNNHTRTCDLVLQSGIFAVTVLSQSQQALAELFAGRVDDHGDRMEGLDLFTLVTGAPFIHGGLSYVDCRVVHSYPMKLSTLFIGEALAAQTGDPDPSGESIPLPGGAPLVYHNRVFTRLNKTP